MASSGISNDKTIALKLALDTSEAVNKLHELTDYLYSLVQENYELKVLNYQLEQENEQLENYLNVLREAVDD